MKRLLTILGIITIAAILIFPFIHKLESSPIKIWDEARYAVNAFEMQHSTNPLIVTFEGKPDYWNAKPPMAIWLMHLSFKVFGYSELGVRMPSVLAGIFILIILIVYSKKVLGGYLPGIFSALAIASTTGIVRYHGTRTGDVDALLTLFITFYALSYFAFLMSGKKHRTLLISMFGIGVLFAFLTKGVAALIPIPGLLIISFLYNNYKTVFTSKYLYLTTITVVVLGVGYYLLRNYYDNYYIKAILNQDIGMFSNEKSFKNFGFYYYKKQIIDQYFYPLAYYLPISLFLSFFTKNDKLKKTMHFATIFFVVFIFVHSLSNTKNNWYDLPAYPFMALLFGGSLQIVYELLQPKLIGYSALKKYFLLILFTFLIFYYPYSKRIESFKPPKRIYEKEWEGQYMRHLKNHRPDIVKYTVSSYKVWPDQIIFYRNIYNQEYNLDISIKKNMKFSPGELVLTCHQASRDYINEHYQFEIIDSQAENCRVYKILGEKQ